MTWKSETRKERDEMRKAEQTEREETTIQTMEKKREREDAEKTEKEITTVMTTTDLETTIAKTEETDLAATAKPKKILLATTTTTKSRYLEETVLVIANTKEETASTKSLLVDGITAMKTVLRNLHLEGIGVGIETTIALRVDKNVQKAFGLEARHKYRFSRIHRFLLSPIFQVGLAGLSCVGSISVCYASCHSSVGVLCVKKSRLLKNYHQER